MSTMARATRTARWSRAAATAAVFACAVSGATDDAVNTTVIQIRTATFALVINQSSCTATAIFQGRRGAAVPLVALYNRPADNRPLDFEPCVSAAVLPESPNDPGAAASATLRVTAAHGYGTVDLAINASSAPSGHIYFCVKRVSDWRVDSWDRHIQVQSRPLNAASHWQC